MTAVRGKLGLNCLGALLQGSQSRTARRTVHRLKGSLEQVRAELLEPEAILGQLRNQNVTLPRILYYYSTISVEKAQA